MRNYFILILVVSISMILFLACSEDNPIQNIASSPNISIGQTSSDTLAIAITASNSEAVNQNTAVAFTKDTVIVSYSVTSYGGGEATIAFSNDLMESKTFHLNNNQAVAQEPILFKPSSVNINITAGYTGVIAMAALGK